MWIYFFRATAGVVREEIYVLRSENLGQIKTRILGASEVPKYDTQIGGGTTLVEPTRDNVNIVTLGVDDDTIIRFRALSFPSSSILLRYFVDSADTDARADGG